MCLVPLKVCQLSFVQAGGEDIGHGPGPGGARLWNSHQLSVSGHQLPCKHSNAAKPPQLHPPMYHLYHHAGLQNRSYHNTDTKHQTSEQ